MKSIIHIDIDSFFASVEEVQNPKLNKIPFVVCCNNHNIIATSNYQARKFGIKSAMSIYEAIKILPNLKIINEDINKYKKISESFFKFIYENITNNIEITSIDECYLDATDILVKEYDNNLFLFLSNIKQKIKNKFGFNISIGSGPNKYISKIMANINKPNSCNIYNKKILLNTSIEFLNLINSSYYKKFSLNKILKISDFLNDKNRIFLENIIGKNKFNKIYNLLENKIEEQLNYNFLKPNTISLSENFKFPISELKFIKNTINNLLIKIINKATKIKIKYINMQVYFKYDKKLLFFSSKINNNELNYLKNIAINLFFKNWNGKEIKLIGISLFNLIN